MDKQQFFVGPEAQPVFPVEATVSIDCYFADPDGGPWEHMPEYSFRGGVLEHRTEDNTLLVIDDRKQTGYHNIGPRRYTLARYENATIYEAQLDPTTRRKVAVQFIFRALQYTNRAEATDLYN